MTRSAFMMQGGACGAGLGSCTILHLARQGVRHTWKERHCSSEAKAKAKARVAAQWQLIKARLAALESLMQLLNAQGFCKPHAEHCLSTAVWISF